MPRGYTSGSQVARVVTEPWAAENLYCPACPSPRLLSLKANTPASDLICPRCEENFQLKSTRSRFTTRIPDAAYSRMIEAIEGGVTPSIFALQYDLIAWRVLELTLIPRFAYSTKDIFRRPPLSASAKRHDWVGCDILLAAIPQSARIKVITDSIPTGPAHVRAQFQRLKPLQRVSTRVRGWTLDVLRIVEAFGEGNFSLQDVYAFERDLRVLHPKNRHVREKIRQQIQVLRDLHFIEFLDRGHYRLL